MNPTKRETLEALLNEPHKLPLGTFSKLTATGIPDDGSQALRAKCWLLLLGVLDARQDKSTYETQLQHARENYYGICEAVSKSLDLFSAAQSPQCKKQDKALIESAQDVDRTGCGLAFWAQTVPQDQNAMAALPLARRMFTRLHLLRPHRSARRSQPSRLSTTTVGSSPTNFESRPSTPNAGSATSTPSVETEPDSRQDQLHRLLFLWALLNPSGYVQGMSEIAAVLYFVFASSDQQLHAEADTFAAFSRLLGSTGLLDLFSPAEDGLESSHSAFNSSGGTGLGAVLARLFERVSACDPPLALHFKQEGVQPSFFAIKWLTTLFAQSFDVATVLPLWDWLIAQQYSQPPVEEQSQLTPFIEALIDLSTTFILGLSDRLVDANFALCLGYLQSIECHMPSAVVAAASSLQEKRLTAPLIVEPVVPAAPLKMSLRDRLKAAAEGAAKSYASLAETDAAANFQKSATNWGIAASSLRDSIGTADRATISHKVQSLGSSLNKSWRPTSPTIDQPFAPPESPNTDSGLFPSPSIRRGPLLSPSKEDQFEPPTTPRQKPLLLGAGGRPSSSTVSHNALSDSISSQSSLLSPNTSHSHKRRISATPGGGLLGYVPSPTTSPSFSKANTSGLAYHHDSSPRTLLDDVQTTPDYPRNRRRGQTTDPASPSYVRKRSGEESPSSYIGSRQHPQADTSTSSSLNQEASPATSTPANAARTHAQRYSISTRPARSDSLAASFSPSDPNASFEQQQQDQQQSTTPELPLSQSLADLSMEHEPETGSTKSSGVILQPVPKRKAKISSSRRKRGSTSSRASSAWERESFEVASAPALEAEDTQEVLLPPIDDASLSPENVRTGRSESNSPGYDNIFDSYR